MPYRGKPYPALTTGFGACCKHCHNLGSTYVVTFPITDYNLGIPTPSPISDTMLISRAFRLGESRWPSSSGKARMVTGNQRLVELAGVEGVDSEAFFFAKWDAGHGHGWRSLHVFTFIAEYMGPINRQRHMVLERVVKIRLVIRDNDQHQYPRYIQWGRQWQTCGYGPKLRDKSCSDFGGTPLWVAPKKWTVHQYRRMGMIQKKCIMINCFWMFLGYPPFWG